MGSRSDCGEYSQPAIASIYESMMKMINFYDDKVYVTGQQIEPSVKNQTVVSLHNYILPYEKLKVLFKKIMMDSEQKCYTQHPFLTFMFHVSCHENQDRETNWPRTR